MDIRDEELTECAEEQEEVDMKSIQGYWRRRNEILPFVTKEEISEPQKIDLKPLPTELKYAYLEDHEQFLVVISALLSTTQEIACCKSSNRTRKPLGGGYLI